MSPYARFSETASGRSGASLGFQNLAQFVPVNALRTASEAPFGSVSKKPDPHSGWSVITPFTNKEQFVLYIHTTCLSDSVP